MKLNFVKIKSFSSLRFMRNLTFSLLLQESTSVAITTRIEENSNKHSGSNSKTDLNSKAQALLQPNLELKPGDEYQTLKFMVIWPF